MRRDGCSILSIRFIQKKMKEIFKIKPIGIVHSKFKTRKQVINSEVKENIGEIEISKEYEKGLSDIDGFSHITVIWWMHKSSFKSLKVRPLYHPEKLRGVFATRSPDRPNPIGITIVELLERKENILKVKGIDMIDGTPVLDIKPYTKGYQKIPTKFGWFSEKKYNDLNF
jgi:tRNA-Thr(GGU) m(6)t(6)A37 methyltransferase TsaA